MICSWMWNVLTRWLLIIRQSFFSDWVMALNCWWSPEVFPSRRPSGVVIDMPVLDKLDPNRYISFRLFREHCVFQGHSYVKHLGIIGRDLRRCLIIDNSPNSFQFQPENGIEIKNYIDDQGDNELKKMTPFLIGISKTSDVRLMLRNNRMTN